MTADPLPRSTPTTEGVSSAAIARFVDAAEADPGTVVERLPTAAAGPTRYEPVTAGRFRRSRNGSVSVG